MVVRRRSLAVSLKRKVAFSILFSVVFAGISEALPAPAALYSLGSGTSTEQMAENSARPALGSALVDSAVPSYYWYYGCSPTSGGMIIGYWDSKPGYQNLFDGDASLESAATQAMIAGQAHITAGAENGYTYGDWRNSPSYPNHENNPDCIADFMHTANGATSPANIASGLEAYAKWNNPATDINESFQATASNFDDPYWGGTFTYSNLKTEIDSYRPVLLDVYTYHVSGWHGHSIVCYGYQDAMFTLFPAGGSSNIVVPGIAVDDTWTDGTTYMSEWLLDTDGNNVPDSYYNSYIDPYGVEWWPYYTFSDTAGYTFTDYWDWCLGDAVTLDITVPEPATVLLLTLGAIALIKKR
jgi:hypothetical protein